MVARPRQRGGAGARRPAEGGRESSLDAGLRSGQVARILGAVPHDDGTVELTVWAPRARTLEVHDADGAHALDRDDDGMHRGRFAGGEYLLAIDGTETYPDPCSRHQPYGVRGPSAVVDPRAFPWSDAGWRGLALDDLVIYELHVGTFSRRRDVRRRDPAPAPSCASSASPRSS